MRLLQRPVSQFSIHWLYAYAHVKNLLRFVVPVFFQRYCGIRYSHPSRVTDHHLYRFSSAMLSRFIILESVRGFAAFYVIAGHLILDRVYDKNSLAGFVLRFGQEAVIAFFILSGFVICISQHKEPDKSFALYFKKRARRIFPIYVFALLFSACAMYFTSEERTLPSIPQILGNLFMLQDFQSGKPGVWLSPLGGNVPLWSLSYEWWFYMMFFPVSKYIPENRRLDFVAAISLLGYCSYQVAPNQISLFLMYFILWWSGVELARNHLAGVKLTLISQWKLLTYLLLGTALLAMPVVASYVDRQVLSLGTHPILEVRHFSACFFLLTLGLVWKNLKWIGFIALFKPFSTIAPISYAAYVFHYPIVAVVLSASLFDNLFLNCTLAVFATVIVSYLAEVHFQRLVNRSFPLQRKP